MASSSTILLLSSVSSHRFHNLSSVILPKHGPPSLRTTIRTRLGKVAASSSSEPRKQTPTKLVTFLGKGGSGKTTSAIFAAQVYAMAGLNTCLVIQSQDSTAEMLLKCKIGTSPVKCSERLSAVRLQTTKMLLEPFSKLKQADARLNLTQGVLEEIVGEELGVLPGMDSIFAALALEKLVGFFETAAKRNHQAEKFNIVLYDGISTEETLRMIGAASKAKLYLKYLRNIAEKTDIGRLAGPSLMRLVDEGLGLSNHVSFNGTLSSEIWDSLEQALERGSSTLTESLNFGCYLVMDLNSQPSFQSALRYWGCAIQSGTQVCGAFGVNPKDSRRENAEKAKEQISPLPFALLPHFSVDNPPDWSAVVSSSATEDARNMLSIPANQNNTPVSPVKFDATNKAVTLFMPGFDKSEIKLYQYRGGSELLVEAGDQRRIICLPQQIQGKVGGAKFTDRNLVITMR